MDSRKKLLSYTALAAYFYIFMEWLFFATKPSFLNGMSVYENLALLLISGGMTAFIFGIPSLVLFFASALVKRKSFSALLLGMAIVPSAFLSGALVLILADNFTYTVFKFGIVTSMGIWRGVYGLLFLYLIWTSARKVLQLIRTPLQSKSLRFLPPALLTASLLLAGERFINRGSANDSELTATLDNRPHILLIGSDGVNAENMSLYGYKRETTPFLEELSSSSLLAENALSNWNSSAASITSMLTGKPPLEIRVFSGEDVLTGIHAYQHLPGILRNNGYLTIQMGVPSYVDAYIINMQDAFDEANGRSVDQGPLFRAARKIGQGDSAYFITRLFERISDRIMHIYYYRSMVNPIEQVTVASAETSQSDSEKIAYLKELLRNSEKPVFAHIHLMGTHGPKFSFSEQVFSAGQEQSQEWMPDFYDDSILTYDGYISDIYNELESSGQLDNTILIIYSDHGQAYDIQRVPLMIRFPNGEFAQTMKSNIQNMDIAPTILDYLEFPIPDWMKGRSLLNGEPPQNRILAIGNVPETQVIIQCDKTYQVAVKAQLWIVLELRGHTAPCYVEPRAGADIPTDVRNYYLQNNIIDDAYQNYSVLKFDHASSRATRRDLATLLLIYMGLKDDGLSPAQGIFTDVPAGVAGARAIEYLYLQGILDACQSSPLSFCPKDDVTRQDAAIALLRGAFGGDYVPPPATGSFSDVPISSPYAPWVEDMYKRGITSGCAKNPLSYCPESPLQWSHLRLFLEKIFFN